MGANSIESKRQAARWVTDVMGSRDGVMKDNRQSEEEDGVGERQRISLT